MRRGEVLDSNGVYYYARLSPKYPTVEIRIADAGLTAEDAVLLAGLARALVVTILAEARACVAPRPVRTALVAASLTAAARGGYPGDGIDPGTGQVLPQHVLAGRLLEYVRPALEASGDLATIERQLAVVRAGETGAARQRALFAGAGSPAALVAELASTTLAEVAPARCRGDDRWPSTTAEPASATSAARGAARRTISRAARRRSRRLHSRSLIRGIRFWWMA